MALADTNFDSHAASRRFGRGRRGMACGWAVLPLILFVFVAASLGQTSQPASSYDEQTIARPGQAATQASRSAATTTGLDWQRLVLAMAVVLGLIFVLKFVAGKAFPSLAAGKGSRAVRVLSRSPLAPKQQLMLVQVGRRVLVIGDSAGELTSLSEITDPDEVASLIGQLENAQGVTAPSKPFAGLFGRALDAYVDPAIEQNSAEPTASRQAMASDDAELPVSEELKQTQTEISGLIDRMRSLTRTMRQ